MSLPVVSAVNAAMKVLYPGGAPRKAQQSNRKLLSKTKKDKGFKGESMYVPIQHADAQGLGSSVAIAQGGVTETSYKRFNLTRVKHYVVARCDGELLEAASAQGEGSLVKMWQGIMDSSLNAHYNWRAAMWYGDGSGALGQTSSGVSGTTVTMASTTNMNYFDLNMRLGAIDSRSTSATVRSGSATVTGIHRVNKTLTFAAAPDTTITNLTNGDWFTRFGDGTSTGTAKVPTGLREYVKDSPGTLFGLDRSADPTRLAGHVFDASSYTYEEAICEGTAVLGEHGSEAGRELFIHNYDYSKLKRSIGTRIQLDRVASSEGKHGFSRVVIEGESNPITVNVDPFAPIGEPYLLAMDCFDEFTLGAAPHLKEDDGNKYARLLSDDAIEARWAYYGNNRVWDPSRLMRFENYGGS